MISVVDTHSHIDLPVFDEDREEMIARALRAGVHAIVIVGFDRERWATSRLLCEQYPFVARTVGVHPNATGSWSETLLADLRQELSLGDAIAVGEIGLDCYRDSAAPDIQRAAFGAQLRLATELGLPVVIHQRAAEADTLTVLSPYGTIRGIMHCFSGGVEFAERCLALGLYLGIGGVSTYPKSQEIRAAIAAAPLERLVVETDAPYLAPQSIRGRRNEPAMVLEALRVIASAHDITLQEAAEVTSANAAQLFGPRIDLARAAGEQVAKCA